MAVIVTRAGKGSPLTNAEVDQNFINLNAAGSSLSGQLTINTSGAIPLAGPLSATSPLRLIGNGPNGSRLEFDVFGSGAAFVGRRASGTPDAPTAVKANDFLLSLNAFGYGATAFSAGPRAQIIAFADEDWTDTAQGTRLDLYTSPTGAAVSTKRWTVGSAGHFTPGLSNTYDIGNLAGGARIVYAGGRFNVDMSNLAQRPVGSNALFYGAGGIASQVCAQLDAFQNAPGFMGRAAMGTPAAPTAAISGLALVQLDGRGYGATGYSTQRGVVDIAAAENWTDAAQGAAIRFATTINGSNALAYRWYFSDAGHLSPFTASAYDLGTPAVPARSGYFSNRLSVNFSGQLPGLPALDVATMLQLTSGAAARIEMNTFNGGVAYISTRHARGAPGAPTATQSGDWMASWGARGYGATGYAVSEAATLVARASENWTDTAQGTNFVVGATPVGQTAIKWSWLFQGEGHLTPYTDAVSDLGSPTLRVRNGYFSGTVQASVVGAGPSAMMAMSGSPGVNSVLYFDAVTPGKLGAFVYQFPSNNLDLTLGGLHVATFKPAGQSLTVDGLVAAGISPGIGSAILSPGGAANSGYLAFFDPANTRIGYIGYGATASKILNITAEAGCSYVFTEGFRTVGEMTFGASLDLVEPRGRYWARPAPSGNYILALADAGSFVVNVATAPNTITIPPQSAVAWKSWTRIDFVQYGPGQITFAPGAGVLLNSAGGKRKTTGVMSAASLIQINPDEWLLVGDLAL